MITQVEKTSHIAVERVWGVCGNAGQRKTAGSNVFSGRTAQEAAAAPTGGVERKKEQFLTIQEQTRFD